MLMPSVNPPGCNLEKEVWLTLHTGVICKLGKTGVRLLVVAEMFLEKEQMKRFLLFDQ